MAAKTLAEAEQEFKKREDARKKLVIQPTHEEKLQATTELNQELLDENEKLKKLTDKDEISEEQEEAKERISEL